MGGEGYLLQPDLTGESPVFIDRVDQYLHGLDCEVGEAIKVDSYNGFGDFGNSDQVDCYVWLAIMNLPDDELVKITTTYQDRESVKQVLREYAIQRYSSFAEVLVDPEGNKHWKKDVFAKIGEYNYEAPFPMYSGKTMNELIESGEWRSERAPQARYPLKIARYGDSVYEDLEESLSDPEQGCGRHWDEPAKPITVVFTGKMSGSRAQMEYEAKLAGFTVSKSITKSMANNSNSYLVCGDRVGAAKIRRAEELGITMITENTFFDMVNKPDPGVQ